MNLVVIGLKQIFLEYKMWRFARFCAFFATFAVILIADL